MNLYISSMDYDYHSLLKAAEAAGLAGIIGFHEADGGYLLNFPGDLAESMIQDYKVKLNGLENNIWLY